MCFATESRHFDEYQLCSILADLFLYLYEADFIQDDVLSISNSKFCDFVDHLYPVDIEIKDTI